MQRGGVLLNEYLVFWIKEEFAYHYFYKNDILYRFLKLYQKNKDRQDLSTQYDYITNNFPRHTLVSHLKRFHPNRVHIQKQSNQFEIYNETQYMALHIHKRHLKFYCETLYDAEELLFPTLRLFQPLLFVMGKKDQEDYGWISPVTKNRKYNNGQVLYSYQ